MNWVLRGWPSSAVLAVRKPSTGGYQFDGELMLRQRLLPRQIVLIPGDRPVVCGSPILFQDCSTMRPCRYHRSVRRLSITAFAGRWAFAVDTYGHRVREVMTALFGLPTVLPLASLEEPPRCVRCTTGAVLLWGCFRAAGAPVCGAAVPGRGVAQLRASGLLSAAATRRPVVRLRKLTH
jgi:hypothetical protein